MQTAELESLKAIWYQPSGQGYKTRCTECGRNNFYVTEHNGKCFCFNCGIMRYIDGVERVKETPSEHIAEIRALYTELAAHYHRALRKQDIDFLRERGLTLDTIEEMQYGYCDDESSTHCASPFAEEAGIAYRDRHGDLRPSFAGRLTIPYFVDNEVTDIRGRSYEDESLKYRSPSGSATFRDANYAYNWKDYPGDYILTEGEIKAAAAHQAGFKCIALPGMNSWRRYILPRPEDRVVVIFDSMADPIATVLTNKAVARVARMIPNVHVTTLPLLGKQKQDIDSFLLEPNGGVERLRDLVGRAIAYPIWKSIKRF